MIEDFRIGFFDLEQDKMVKELPINEKFIDKVCDQ